MFVPKTNAKHLRNALVTPARRRARRLRRLGLRLRRPPLPPGTLPEAQPPGGTPRPPAPAARAPAAPAPGLAVADGSAEAGEEEGEDDEAVPLLDILDGGVGDEEDEASTVAAASLEAEEVSVEEGAAAKISHMLCETVNGEDLRLDEVI